ncbi:MAG: hypothetical protein FWD34_07350 [Oscillospiraceae bacterium]|nr:hypothetical protein [Oscillospiraceae bacterium]
MASLKERLDSRSNTFQSSESQKETERLQKVSEISNQVWNELRGVFENLSDEDLCNTVTISVRIESLTDYTYTVSSDNSGKVKNITVTYKCTIEDLQESLSEAFALAETDSIATFRCGYVWQFIYSPPFSDDEHGNEMELAPAAVFDDNFMLKLLELKDRYAGIDAIAVTTINTVGYDNIEELKKQLKKVNGDTKSDEKSERERLSGAVGAYSAKRAGELEAILKETFEMLEKITA